MKPVFIRRGDDAFNPFIILSNPLGDSDELGRNNRVFHRNGKSSVTYASHVLKLAEDGHTDALYILMQNGLGKEVLRIPPFYDDGTLRETIVSMPERVQYGLLFSIWQVADGAKSQARRKSNAEWSSAFISKRIKKTKKKGSTYVSIIPDARIEECEDAGIPF